MKRVSVRVVGPRNSLNSFHPNCPLNGQVFRISSVYTGRGRGEEGGRDATCILINSIGMNEPFNLTFINYLLSVASVREGGRVDKGVLSPTTKKTPKKKRIIK